MRKNRLILKPKNAFPKPLLYNRLRHNGLGTLFLYQKAAAFFGLTEKMSNAFFRLMVRVIICFMGISLNLFGYNYSFASTGAVETHGGHFALPPRIYVLQWYLLVLIFIVGLWYFLKVKSGGKPHQESLLPAYILVILVFGYYTLSYLPAIKNYHEPVKLGFLRFIFLVVDCFLVTKYGVLGRHEEHSVSHDAHSAAQDAHVKH